MCDRFRLRPLPFAAGFFLLVTLSGSLAGADSPAREGEAPAEPQLRIEDESTRAAQQELRPPGTPSASQAASSVATDIDAAVREAMREQKIPGLSICVADENEVIFSSGYGLADVENDVPVTTATVFRTASIAKAMTAVAAMRLASRGELDLDAPVQTYVPCISAEGVARFDATTAVASGWRPALRQSIGSEHDATLRHRRRWTSRVRR